MDDASRRRALWAARGSFAVIPAWLLLTALTLALGPSWLGLALDLPLGLLCHRIPERVPVVWGAPLPLCSRCLGLWLGLSLGACFAWPALPIARLRLALGLALGLMALDILTQDLGLRPVWHSTRFVSGLLVAGPFGGTLGAMVTQQLLGRAGAR